MTKRKKKEQTTKTTTIIDPNTGKIAEVEDILIIYHTLPNENGSLRKEKCVEFTVIGHNGMWRNWALLDAFKQNNPGILLEEDA